MRLKLPPGSDVPPVATDIFCVFRAEFHKFVFRPRERNHSQTRSFTTGHIVS